MVLPNQNILQPRRSGLFSLSYFTDYSLYFAGDKTALPLPQDQIISSNLEKFRRPITLPPSTLSDEMLLFASLETESPKVTPSIFFRLISLVP